MTSSTHIPVNGSAAALACAVLLALSPVAARADDAASTRVQALMQQGKLDEALGAADAELKQDAASVTYRFLKGSILTRLNRLDEAAAIFQKLTEEHPELPEPYNNLAVVYAAQGDYERARQALQKAINTHPSYATAHENLGDIYAKMASQAYNHALQLDQDNASAKTKLSLITDLFSLPSGKTVVAQASQVEAQAAAAPAPAPTAPPPETKPPSPAATAAPVAEPVPAPAPAAPVAAASAPSPSAGPASPAAQSDQDAVRQAVLGWAAAWSSQDAAAYLACYADDFTSRDGETRDRWAEGRKARLAAARFIKVGVVNLEVAMLGGDHARATFLQDYQSDAFSDRIRKMLLLKKVGDRWLITQESIR